jgi:3-oxoacyl-(acyl-carrier-protein) synthase
MMCREERIVITGMEVISPFGGRLAAFHKGLEEGRSALRKITRFPTKPPSGRWGGEVPDFDPAAVDSDYRFLRLPIITQYGIAAAQGALADGHVDRGQGGEDLGVMVAVTHGIMGPTRSLYSNIFGAGPQTVNPLDFQNSVHNSIGSEISIRLGLKSYNITLTSGPSGGALGLLMASSFLRSGRCRQVLVIGAEELTETTFNAYDHLKTLSKCPSERDACRPFDAARSGMVLSEGAAAVLLESLPAAEARGAPIYAEVAGIGTGHDAFAPSGIAPGGAGLETAVRSALRQGGAQFAALDFVCAAANSSRSLDAAESSVLSRIGGAASKQVPVTSIKSMLGEAFSAGGMFNVAACIIGMKHGFIPPTLNFERGDIDCALAICRNMLPKQPMHLALAHAMSFGGNHVAVLLKNHTH